MTASRRLVSGGPLTQGVVLKSGHSKSARRLACPSGRSVSRTNSRLLCDLNVVQSDVVCSEAKRRNILNLSSVSADVPVDQINIAVFSKRRTKLVHASYALPQGAAFFRFASRRFSTNATMT